MGFKMICIGHREDNHDVVKYLCCILPRHRIYVVALKLNGNHVLLITS